MGHFKAFLLRIYVDQDVSTLKLGVQFSYGLAAGKNSVVLFLLRNPLNFLGFTETAMNFYKTETSMKVVCLRFEKLTHLPSC